MKLRNIVNYMIGPVGVAIIGFLTIPLLTWTFSQEDVGRYNFFQSLISLFILFSVLGLDQAYMRFYNNTKEKIILLISCMIPGALMLLVIYFIFYNFLFVFFGVNKSTLVFIFLIFFINHINKFLSLYLRMGNNSFIYSLNQIILKVLIMLGVVFCFYKLLANDFDSLVSILFISYFCSFLFLLLFSLKLKNNEVNEVKVEHGFNFKQLYSFGLPLLFSSIIYWGLCNINIIFLREINYSSLAIYTVSMSIASVVGVLQSIFSTIWVPYYYKLIEMELYKDVSNSFHGYAIFIITIISFLTYLLSPILRYFFPKDYNMVSSLFPLCIFFSLLYLLGEIVGIGLQAAKKTTYVFVTISIAFLVNCLLSFVLIPILNVKGAVISCVLSFFIYYILRGFFSNIFWEKHKNMRYYFYIFALLLLNILFLYIDYYLGILIFVSFVSVFIFFERSILTGIILKVRGAKW